jgi:hypothetical protein
LATWSASVGTVQVHAVHACWNTNRRNLQQQQVGDDGGDLQNMETYKTDSSAADACGGVHRSCGQRQRVEAAGGCSLSAEALVTRQLLTCGRCSCTTAAASEAVICSSVNRGCMRPHGMAWQSWYYTNPFVCAAHSSCHCKRCNRKCSKATPQRQ